MGQGPITFIKSAVNPPTRFSHGDISRKIHMFFFHQIGGSFRYDATKGGEVMEYSYKFRLYPNREQENLIAAPSVAADLCSTTILPFGKKPTSRRAKR